MAACADHESLASPLGHDPCPLGLFGRPGLAEIGELSDLVDLHLVRLSAELAPSLQEPVDQLLAGAGGRDWFAFVEDRVLLASERDTPPNVATSGLRPWPRSTLACKHLRGPSGVSIVTLYLRTQARQAASPPPEPAR